MNEEVREAVDNEDLQKLMEKKAVKRVSERADYYAIFVQSGGNATFFSKLSDIPNGQGNVSVIDSDTIKVLIRK